MSVERWRQMHADQVARAAQGDIDVMFVGDSLTEMWPKQMWEHHFGHMKAANFGIGGDHTGNVLWRLQDPALARLKPKLVVLMIGVNNINLCKESADDVFGGIQAVVAALRKQYPQAHILLNAVLPEGAPDSDERRRIVSLNQKVRTLDDGKAVFFHDYSAHFMGEGGVLSKELQPDLLHFSEKGYAVLADAIRPDVERLLASARANPEIRGGGPRGSTTNVPASRAARCRSSVTIRPRPARGAGPWSTCRPAIHRRGATRCSTCCTGSAATSTNGAAMCAPTPSSTTCWPTPRRCR
jgi:lysophospholipase L1-like esterase